MQLIDANVLAVCALCAGVLQYLAIANEITQIPLLAPIWGLVVHTRLLYGEKVNKCHGALAAYYSTIPAEVTCLGCNVSIVVFNHSHTHNQTQLWSLCVCIKQACRGGWKEATCTIASERWALPQCY